MTDRVQRLTGVFLAFLLVQRAWERLLYADFWAEDGKVFFGQALTDGWASVVSPMAGTFFVIERAIMVAAVKVVPLVWVPTAVCAACLLVTAGVMSRFVRDDYQWLVPGRAVRAAAAALFCLLPGLNEMLGNLCNLNWILFCWAALAGLTDPDRPLRAREVAGVALVSVSVGTATLLLPLFAWRAFTIARRRPPASVLVPELTVVVVLALLGGALPAMAGGGAPVLPEGVGVPGLVRIAYDHAARLVALTPILGDRLTAAIIDHGHMTALRGLKIACLMAACAWAWRYRRRPAAQALVALTLGVAVWPMLSSLSRVYAYDLFLRQHGAWFYESRYAFVMSFVGVLAWLVALHVAVGSPRRAAWLAAAFIAWNVSLNAHRFDVEAYSTPRLIGRVAGRTVVVLPPAGPRTDPPPRPHWLDAAGELERSLTSGCPAVVRVLQYPDPWAYDFVNPHPAASCADAPAAQ